MKATLLTLLLGLGLVAFSQNPNLDFKVGLKLGNQTSYTPYYVRSSQGDNLHVHDLELVHVVPSVIWRGRKGFFNEGSLTSANWSLLNSGINYTDHVLDLSLKYGKFFAFFRHADHQLVPMLGLEVKAYDRQNKTRSSLTGHPTSVTGRFGAQAFLTGRLAWFPKSHFFGDVSCALGLLDASIYRFQNFSRSIGYREFDFGTPPLLVAQVSVGYKF